MTITSTEVIDSLGPFAELPDWLSALMRPGLLETSLLTHVPELAEGRLELLECRADRCRAKGEEWLVRCRATVAEPDADGREVVLVGKLLPPAEPDPSPPGEPGRGFGEPGYDVFLPDLRLHLHTEETDPGLPTLGALSDAEASARIIEAMLRSGAYPRATVIQSAPTIARYKPGSRCTIVYDLTYDSPDAELPNPVIAKTHVNEKGGVAHDAMTALWNTELATSDAVLLAEPLGYLPDEKVLLQGPVPEDKTLKLLAREAFESMDPAHLDSLRTELSRTAAALAALHRSGAVYRRRVTWNDELDETYDVLDRLTHSVPQLRTWAEPLLERLAGIDSAVPADPIVSAHHDFRPAQVLLSPGRVAFIDFDGAAMAEPGLDLGRFRGKLRDIGVTALSARESGYRADILEERLDLLDEFCDFFLEEYEAHAPVTRERVLLWETIDLLTALLHTWTKVRLLRVEPRLAILLHQLRVSEASG